MTFPKIEQHVHLARTVLPRTLLQTARRNDVPRPADSEAGLRDRYDFRDFAHQNYDSTSVTTPGGTL